ncbi:MAG: enoyl-CoA hydratase/isomerase family protein [Deltaproteobacteria bacterium]|nr:enoyl-CoA hydratase/isomerase family protein [Deltaproteobacteria bacterium]
MNENPILLDVNQGVARITLNLPEVRNALSLEVRMTMAEMFMKLGEDEAVKAIILTGSGKAFSSGGDIRTMEGVNPVAGRLRLKKGHILIKTMLGLEKPIIGAINGVAAGAGVSVALACDFIIASEEARFAVSFSKIGLVPDLGLFYLLPLRIGVPRAKELMFFGDVIDPHQAESLGMVNRVVPAEKLEEEARAMAQRLVQGPGQSYAMIKSALNHWPADLDTFLEMESTMQAVAFNSRDFDEGRRAFLEKRSPVFCGK